MKKINLIILISVFAAATSYGQALKLKTGGSLDILLKSYESKNSFSPYQQDVETLSFATFYRSTAGFNIDAVFNFWSLGDYISDGMFFVGLNFEKSSISTSDVPAKYILGETISQTKLTPYAGFGNFIDPAGMYNFLYGFIGVSVKDYTGEATIPAYYFQGTTPMDVKHFYKGSVALRFGAGIDFENINDGNIFVSFISYFDWGIATRGNGEGTYLGEKIILEPEGQLQITDNTLYFAVSIGYKLDF